MISTQKKKTTLIIAGMILLMGLISLSCNLPAGLEEKIFSSGRITDPTPIPTNTPQPLPPTIVESDPFLSREISFFILINPWIRILSLGPCHMILE